MLKITGITPITIEEQTTASGRSALKYYVTIEEIKANEIRRARKQVRFTKTCLEKMGGLDNGAVINIINSFYCVDKFIRNNEVIYAPVLVITESNKLIDPLE